jgi:hypothetical protein
MSNQSSYIVTGDVDESAVHEAITNAGYRVV